MSEDRGPEEIKRFINEEMRARLLGSGDLARTQYGEFARLGADIQGELIVTGQPFGLKPRPVKRSVTVLATGRLGPDRRQLRALDRNDVLTESRRVAVDLAFRGWAVDLRLSSWPTSPPAVFLLDARRVKDADLDGWVEGG